MINFALMGTEPLFIVGMPASGKSTFGRALAVRLGRRFIDLDRYIENRFRTSVGAIFAGQGEVAFRQLEAAMLREVGEFEQVVISTGGGTPCHNSNMDYINSRGSSLWLQASCRRLAERIMLRPDKRPLLAGLSADELDCRLQQMLQERTHFYNRAEMTFASDLLENRRQIDAAVQAFMAVYGSRLRCAP